jgi:hypothetical protein
MWNVEIISVAYVVFAILELTLTATGGGLEIITALH